MFICVTQGYDNGPRDASILPPPYSPKYEVPIFTPGEPPARRSDTVAEPMGSGGRPGGYCTPERRAESQQSQTPAQGTNTIHFAEGGTATVPSLSVAAKRYYANVGTDVT